MGYSASTIPQKLTEETSQKLEIFSYFQNENRKNFQRFVVCPIEQMEKFSRISIKK
jgi:hypothetical protein